LALCTLAVWLFNRRAEVRWARERAIPEIIKLAEQEEYITAFNLARKAEPYLPSDSMLEELWPEISRKVSIETTPTAADVYIRDYEAIDSDWQHLGTSPMDNIRIPMGFFRWRIEKDGYRTVEAAHSGASGSLGFTLDEEESIPAGMVRVSGGLSRSYNMEPMQLGDFYIDKYEVTKKRFKNFIESGGYRKREYWKHEFIKDGRILSWEEAMAEFRDATGRPGPSTWELGDYPEGQDDYPVTGISWYEAAAYTEFAGKSLPTVYHWLRAAGPHLAQFIIPSSNFDESGPARVGRYQGMGPFGTYDMAGNVKEWCWNELMQMRYIASGAWEDPPYMFSLPYPQSPFGRSAFNGFRCMKHVSPGAITTEAAKPILPRSPRDYRREKPAPNDIFQVYQRLYTYDKTELNPIIESTDETPRYWTKEKITYDAAYGNERIMGYLFLPKNTSPPYQTVIFFPAIDAQVVRSSEKLRMSSIDFIIRSKRAVLFPIYKSTYERGDGYTFAGSESPNSNRDHVILWFKDLGRSIDYLESRKDIDCDRLAYHGLSLGALMGSIYAALEKRLKVSILELGGFITLPGRLVPEAEQINFAPRVTIPTLMLNGRYDSFLPLETSQIPMFRLLGTPEAHKRHVVYDTGHFIPRNEKIKEILDWLDRYLGPVE
jgi:formylglycine-generating enzyme required for sulfatase activity/dienelactone hydrolase